MQVERYQKHISENLTDKRVLKEFLDIVDGLEQLRNRLCDLTKSCDCDLETLYARWSRVLSRRMVNLLFASRFCYTAEKTF